MLKPQYFSLRGTKITEVILKPKEIIVQPPPIIKKTPLDIFYDIKKKKYNNPGNTQERIDYDNDKEIKKVIDEFYFVASEYHKKYLKSSKVNFNLENPGDCKERNEKFYNDMYKNDFNFEIEGSSKKIWRGAVNFFKKHKFENIVDIGCGTGNFAKMFLKINIKNFIGYDFSEEALFKAYEKTKFNRKFIFIKSDLTKYNFITPKNTLYTSFEFLEHINNDIFIIKKIPSKSWFCFSVPNYWTPDHVRIFQTKKDIEKRYKHLFSYLFIKEFYFRKPDRIIITQFFCLGKLL